MKPVSNRIINRPPGPARQDPMEVDNSKKRKAEGPPLEDKFERVPSSARRRKRLKIEEKENPEKLEDPGLKSLPAPKIESAKGLALNGLWEPSPNKTPEKNMYQHYKSHRLEF